MTVVKNIKFTDSNIDGEHCSLDLYLPGAINYSAEKSKINQRGPSKQSDNIFIRDIQELADKSDSVNPKLKVNGTANKSHAANHAGKHNSEQNVHNTIMVNVNTGSESIDKEFESYSGHDGSECTERSNLMSKGHGTPFVVFIHGGGWRRGFKDAWKHYLFYDINFLVSFLQFIVGTYGGLGNTLASNGVACAVISYPLTEAATAVIMFEMFLSCIQCVLVTILTSLPVLITMLVARSVMTQNAITQGLELFFHEHRVSGAVLLYVSSILLLTNLAMYTIIMVKRKHFQVTRKTSLLSAMAFITSFFLVALMKTIPLQNKMAALIFVTGVFVQGVVLRRRCMRQNRNYKDQLHAVSEAVRWCHTLCQETHVADSERIYLMGHSAGGHLATLLVLDNDLLPRDVKIQGVISLSGVYNLLCLNGRLLKYAYLLPTFGHNFADWINASPFHLARRHEDNLKTKFLLLSAERDLFLKQQSLDFYRVLKSRGVNSEHVEISGSNHFSIVTNTKTCFGSPLGYALDFIKCS